VISLEIGRKGSKIFGNCQIYLSFFLFCYFEIAKIGTKKVKKKRKNHFLHLLLHFFV